MQSQIPYLCLPLFTSLFLLFLQLFHHHILLFFCLIFSCPPVFLLLQAFGQKESSFLPGDIGCLQACSWTCFLQSCFCTVERSVASVKGADRARGHPLLQPVQHPGYWGKKYLPYTWPSLPAQASGGRASSCEVLSTHHISPRVIKVQLASAPP